jgi:hypothetical protein
MALPRLDFVAYWLHSTLSPMDYGVRLYKKKCVMINGSALGFFKATRGLCHGCTLSPYVFLLVDEGIIKELVDAKRIIHFQGISYNIGLVVSYLLCVDDMLLFW